MQLYRASDALMRHRTVIERHVFQQAMERFHLLPTVAFYDLTTTYFEGTAKQLKKARHGQSKEKRSDCPLVTLAVVMDGSGFVRHSKVFAGNVSEESTLAEMLTALKARVSSWTEGLPQRIAFTGCARTSIATWL